MKTFIKQFTNILGMLMFWVWNGLAVLVVLFLFLPHVFIPALTATMTGEIPLSISVCSLILLLIPFASIYVGIKRSDRVVAYFYGIEMPIIVLTLLRLFLVRELTFAGAFLIGSGLIAICAFGWYFWQSTKGDILSEKHEPSKAFPQVLLASLILTTGVFVALLSLLYAIPLAVNFVGSFLKFKWIEVLFEDPFLTLIVLLFVCSWFAICLFPLYMAFYYPKMWADIGKSLNSILPRKSFYIISAFTVMAWVSAHYFISLQPNASYTSALNEMGVADKVVQMQNPEHVRKQLLKAYLNEYRYIGNIKKTNNLKNMYIGFDGHRRYSQYGDHNDNSFYNDGLGGVAQSIQNYLLSPLLYKGELNDNAIAGKLYSKLFDISIQRAETPAIAKALKATYDRDEVTAGLMNIGARNVLLTAQNINFEDKGDYAVIEIEETYKNLTFDPQEIFYYFSLPEDAAITGLWIGRAPERDKMDAFIVAPRGAAQKVYERQVRERVDPALLEQVGPRQYRLRVFPIPVTKFRSGRQQRNLNLMHMHLRYVVPLGPDGFALPDLLEKRNINWSRKTKHTLNGRVIKIKNKDAWLPNLPDAQKAFRQWHMDTGFKGWEANTVFKLDQMTKDSVGGSDDMSTPYAVLVDTSYSMNKHIPALKAALSNLEAWAHNQGYTLDFYAAHNNVSPSGDAPQPLKKIPIKDFVGFGTITPQTMLQHYQAHNNNTVYEGIIILTDQGRYAQNIDQKYHEQIDTGTPIWFVHLGKAAFAYDDEVLDALYQSGGGVVQDLSDLKRRLYYRLDGRFAYTSREWFMVRDDSRINNIPKDENIAALAARQHISAASFGTPPTPENLDALHTIAKRYGIVTPYSSMIVLVNQRQKDALKKASQADDRFEREGKNGEETLTSPSSVMVSAVPEPHEWLLILVSLFMLTILWRKRKDWRKAL